MEIKMTTTPALPAAWMPACRMARVHLHWTGGAYAPNSHDRASYHILVDGSGAYHAGDLPINANAAPIRGAYAAHTLNANSGAIGVSLCCMAGAVESPFNPGAYPMTREQWEAGVRAVATLCERYGIPVTPKTVLTHAEVQTNLGIAQRQKWDITRLPFDPSVVGAKAVDDKLRREVLAVMGSAAPVDDAAVVGFRRQLAAGEEELLPSAMIDRVLAGESLVRVWRDHRGLTSKALAEKAGIARAYLSQIEAGKREGTIDTLRKLATALGVAIDDLVP